jgi:hypothetical protein
MYNPGAPFGLELMAERKRRGQLLRSYEGCLLWIFKRKIQGDGKSSPWISY